MTASIVTAQERLSNKQAARQQVEWRKESWWSVVWIATVTASSFMPYVYGGIRIEQLVIYGSLVVVLAANFFGHSVVGLRPGPLPILLLLGTMLVAACISTLLNVSPIVERRGQLSAAALDNFLLPMALILVVWFWRTRWSVRHIVTVVAFVVLLAMTANAIISWTQSIGALSASADVLKAFWADSNSTWTVAESAMNNSRYGGIFNQPAEAGIAYSLAAFCAVYLVAVRRLPHGIAVASLALITLGGVLVYSKVALYFGAPLAVLALALLAIARRRPLNILASLVVLPLLLVLGLNWIDRLDLLYGWSNGWTSFAVLSGGRTEVFAANSLNDYTWNTSPLVGLGMAYTGDSEYYRAFWSGGLVSLISVLTIQVILLARAFLNPAAWPRPEWLMAILAALTAVAGGLGLPALSANRSGTMLMLLLSALVVCGAARRPRNPLKPALPDEEVPRRSVATLHS